MSLYYSLFDCPIQSDIPLPELDEILPAAGIRVVRGAGEGLQRPGQWCYQVQDGWLSFARTDGGYWLYFEDMVDFAISANRREVTYFPAQGLAEESLRHILLDHVLPMVISDSGSLILHASAVVLPSGKAVMFSGESGAGKSTLASYFYTQGARLLTDDCLLLRQRGEQIFVVPNYHGVRLFADSNKWVLGSAYESSEVAHYSSKRRFSVSRSARVPADSEYPLSALFIIDGEGIGKSVAGDEINITPMLGATTLASLLKETFSLDPRDKAIARQRFMDLGALCRTDTGIYRLHYPRSYDVLDCVYDAVRQHVEG